MSERKNDDDTLRELRKLLKQIQDMLERTREKIEDLEGRLENPRAEPPSSS